MHTRADKTPDSDYINIVAKQMNDSEVTAKSTTIQNKCANSNHIFSFVMCFVSF